MGYGRLQRIICVDGRRHMLFRYEGTWEMRKRCPRCNNKAQKLKKRCTTEEKHYKCPRCDHEWKEKRSTIKKRKVDIEKWLGTK